MVQGIRDETGVAIKKEISVKKDNNPVQKPPRTETSRRSFLNKLWMALGFLAIIELAALVVAFLRPGNKLTKEANKALIITAGPVEKFPMDSVTAFVRGKFYLARLADGGFLALSRKCTHLGCTVPWISDKKRFECPCHASAFDIRGEVMRPPAPRALDIYGLHIENNVVKVDMSRVIKRGCFDISQVVYP